MSMNPNGAECDIICACCRNIDNICFMGDRWMKMLVEMKKGDNRQSQETKKKEGKLPG